MWTRLVGCARCITIAFCVCVAGAPVLGLAEAQAGAKYLVQLAPSLSPQVASLALQAARCAQAKLGQEPSDILGIIDYSLPSTEKRFWLFDFKRRDSLLLEDLVAHGRNSGENRAHQFSNALGSLQSSLGLFRVGDRYQGKHGESLKLLGLEPGVNDRAMERTLVLHSAPYVSEEFIRLHQRLGRSWGCPVVNRAVISRVIDAFDEGKGYLFIYYPDKDWLNSSELLTQCN